MIPYNPHIFLIGKMSRIFGLKWGKPNYQQLHSHLNVAWLWQIMVFATERTVKELGAYPLNWGTGQWGMILDPLIDNSQPLFTMNIDRFILNKFHIFSIQAHKKHQFYCGFMKIDHIHFSDHCVFAPGVSSRWRCWSGSSDMRSGFLFVVVDRRYPPMRMINSLSNGDND